MQQFDNFMLLI